MVAAGLANMPLGGAQYRSANLQTDTPQVSQSQAAELLQVSPRSVATAAKVEREAPAEVVEAVKAGAGPAVRFLLNAGFFLQMWWSGVSWLEGFGLFSRPYPLK